MQDVTLVDRTITALRATHDELAALAGTLTREQLDQTSGATEWSLAQVFSHMGSGSEIGLAGLLAALGQAPAPAEGFNDSVWDRWNALDPLDQAAGFVEHSGRLVETFEALTPQQRETLGVPVSFMPQPMPVLQVAGLRIGELALHGWDVRAGLDPQAALRDEEAALIAEHYTGGLAFVLGFASKADQLEQPALVDLAGSGYGLAVDEKAALTSTPADPTATFSGPLEAAMRMLAGRLTPRHTPDGVTVTGNVTLDDLRRVFPGY